MTAVLNAKSDWVFDRNLGAGGFGIVQLWVHKQSRKKLAIKKCRWDKSQLKEIQEKRWIHEVDIMKVLQHPNIVKTIELPIGIYNEDTHLPILCMEYCTKGDLRRILNQPENCCGIAETEVINVMRDICSAVQYLHSFNITHRDLKPENIVLQDEFDKTVYKLIDLGYAKELGDATTSASLVGTMNYVAPELLWQERYSCSVDYWSLGILFYELITGVRPFLPRMPYTITWIRHIRNKAYEDICAFESDGKIIFGKDIQGPTQISSCLRCKLVEWFRVALQWDPKKRGKKYDENGKPQLVIFKMLHSIVSKKIIYVYSVALYKINAYEMTDTTTVMELQHLIEKDTNIQIHQQILTDYFGKRLISNGEPIVLQTNDTMLFVFQAECALDENIPALEIPIAVQKMLEQARNELPFDTMEEYYRSAVFFMKEEIYKFRLYIFAVTIKADLVMTRLHRFHKNITDAIADIDTLQDDLRQYRSRFKDVTNNKDKAKTFEIISGKIIQLSNAAVQIKRNFEPLVNESQQLQSAADSINIIQGLVELYDKSTAVFETFKQGNTSKTSKPTEMVKIVFDFLRIRETQINNERVKDVLKKSAKLEGELVTLEKIFYSVIAVTTEYRKDLQNTVSWMIQESASANLTSNTPKESDSVPLSVKESENVDVEHDNKKQQSISDDTSSTGMDVEDDVIYDNLVIRYTLDNLLLEIQKKCFAMMSLE